MWILPIKAAAGYFSPRVLHLLDRKPWVKIVVFWCGHRWTADLVRIQSYPSLHILNQKNLNLLNIHLSVWTEKIYKYKGRENTFHLALNESVGFYYLNEIICLKQLLTNELPISDRNQSLSTQLGHHCEIFIDICVTGISWNRNWVEISPKGI